MISIRDDSYGDEGLIVRATPVWFRMHQREADINVDRWVMEVGSYESMSLEKICATELWGGVDIWTTHLSAGGCCADNILDGDIHMTLCTNGVLLVIHISFTGLQIIMMKCDFLIPNRRRSNWMAGEDVCVCVCVCGVGSSTAIRVIMQPPHFYYPLFSTITRQVLHSVH